MKIKYLPLPIAIELAFDPDPKWAENFKYTRESLTILKAPTLDFTIIKNGWYLINNKFCFYYINGTYYTSSKEEFKKQLQLYDFKFLSYDNLKSLCCLYKNNQLPLQLRNEIRSVIALDYDAKYYAGADLWYYYWGNNRLRI